MRGNERSITPPPLKRRKVEVSEHQSTPEVPAHSSQAAITLYSWNVNGIAPFIQASITSFFNSPNETSPAQKASLRDFLRRHDWPTMLFLQEVKIPWGDESTIRAVEKAIQLRKEEASDAPEYLARFCLPSDSYNAKGFGGKVYGVCSIVRKDFYDACVTRVRPVEWDSEGRFLVIETEPALGMPKLAYVNIYAVNGTSNPYKDPIDGTIAGTRHDRKLQVHRLLAAECRKLQAQGYSVVLAGDMNIARAKIDGHPNLRTHPHQHSVNRADFETRFFGDTSMSASKQSDNETACAGSTENANANGAISGLGMIDAFRTLHPKQKGYTYYPRTRNFGDSCDRVDMILISGDLETSLVDAGMHSTPAERGPSDHVPLFARLRFTQQW